MKQAYLIYHPAEARKNQRFIQMFQDAGRAYGISFAYRPPQECQQCGDADLVLNRTREPAVSRWFQERGIPVFHPADFTETANDKYLMIRYFRLHLPDQVTRGKWCPRTWFFPAGPEQICGTAESLGISADGAVIKSTDGHGGNEVFLLEDHAHWQKALQGRDVIIQERISSDSQDVRVYILGREIYQAVLRTGVSDFRSNHSLGGRVEAYGLTGEQRDLVMRFVYAMPEDWQGMYGIDFILDREGQLIFNEVEEMVGCRMLYGCTKRDIVRDYVAWLGGICPTGTF